jgi:hypothetical protein
MFIASVDVRSGSASTLSTDAGCEPVTIFSKTLGARPDPETTRSARPETFAESSE